MLTLKLIVLLSIFLETELQMGPLGPPGGPPTGPVVKYNFSASLKDSSDPIISMWITSTGLSGYNALTNVNKVQYSPTYVYVSSSVNII